jgi:hypothetical protein
MHLEPSQPKCKHSPSIFSLSWLLAALVMFHTARAFAQVVPLADDTRHSMLREAMLGLLPVQASVDAIDATQKCLTLPVDPPNDRLQGQHGGVLLTTRCIVSAYENLPSATEHGWTGARYQWTSIFTGEDSAARPHRDTVTEEEVVLFEAVTYKRVRAIWHVRYETGAHGMWVWISAETVLTRQGATLISVMSCFNGTGGCGQEFLHQHADGRWFPVWQEWLDQLPQGFANRIQHGVRIDPRTLRGKAGFYGGRDPNCCPSQFLIVDLALRADSLALEHYRLDTNPEH